MTSHRRTAFTLVELLVVIGIIAILISILLPVVSRAQDQARSAACKSNLRQIFVAVQTYAQNNRGLLPIGFRWERQDSLGQPLSPTSEKWIAWFTLLNHSMSPRSAPDITNGLGIGGFGFMGYRLSPVFRCPGAANFPQQVHYYQHGVAMPHLPMEMQNSAVVVTPSNGTRRLSLTTPARFTDLYNDNMLFWDTPLVDGVDPRVSLPFYKPSLDPQAPSNEAGSANNVLPLTFIDGRLLRDPLRPELRFRAPDQDLFANASETSFLRGNQTIYFPTDESAIQGTASLPAPLKGSNVDVGAGGTTGGVTYSHLIGSVRFRHEGNRVANVVFADGSVQGMTFARNKIISAGGLKQSYDTTIKRKMLQIRWPTGYAPSASFSTP
ncbi:MAG: prepilin-type N-terminal cleavage/methylation domain-containing protein [Phycisphaerae bacterium]|nr:prepilin-type N-terminal cleavage/methylation domain-containing protein [Phycisphaerae bacterium]MDW8261519.1 prepilin-type N-terminal cleavage/methylation domain-containing protein [Phycisphaerales bacterium]